jgi:hypothetical protein
VTRVELVLVLALLVILGFASLLALGNVQATTRPKQPSR